MNSKLSVLSGQEIVKRLEKFGFTFVRQTGDHLILRRERPPKMTLSVPNHKQVKKGTLRGILRQASIKVEDF